MKPANISTQQLIDQLQSINQSNQNPINIAAIQEAIDYIQPYYAQLHATSIERPITVAYMTLAYCTDTATIITALLQDLAKHTTLDLSQIAQKFGGTVTQQLSKLVKLEINLGFSVMETVKEMHEEGETNLLVIKLLDNIYTMQRITLHHIKHQEEAALENIKVFLPIAIYLEVQEIEKEIANICQSILYLKPKIASIDPVLKLTLVYQP